MRRMVVGREEFEIGYAVKGVVDHNIIIITIITIAMGTIWELHLQVVQPPSSRQVQ